MLRTAAAGATTMRAPTTLGALLLVFLLGMWLRLYELDATGLWADELYTASRVDLGLSSMIDSVATAGDNPPLSFVIVRSFVDLLGDSDFVYRLASAILGSLSVLLTYKVGTALWTRKVGLVGSFLLAVNPFHIEYSQWARHYAITMFLVLLSLVLFLKALETGRRGHWLGFAVAAALSIYSQYFAFLALGAMAIYGFSLVALSTLLHAGSSDSADEIQASKAIPAPTQQAMRLACSLGLVGLLFSPWLPSMVGHICGPIGWEGFGGPTAIQTHELSAYLHRWPTEYVGTNGPLAVAFLALSVLGLARSRREHVLFVALWVGVPLLFSLTVASTKLAAPRYSIFVLPVYLLTVGRGGLFVASALVRLLSRSPRIGEPAALLATPLVLVAFAALSAAPLRAMHLSGPNEDWHAVAQHLADNMLPGDIVLADGVGYGGIRDSPRAIMALSHYLPIHGLVDTPVLRIERGLWAQLSTIEQGQGRVWAVLWHSGRTLARRSAEHPGIVRFPSVLVISPTETSSGDRLQDAASTLEVLLDIMPTRAGCFEVRLALSEVYLATWQLEDAQSLLQQASAAQPDQSQTSRELRTALLDLEQTAEPLGGARHPLRYNLGRVAALLAYEIRTSSPGSVQSLDVTLWWGALAEMEKDYTAFVHLVDQDGSILAQDDRLLQRGNLPCSGWPLGSLTREEYHLEPETEAAPGDYVVKIGLYYWETGERLPVWDERGHRQPDDTIVVIVPE
jgi:mannosyltransferase